MSPHVLLVDDDEPNLVVWEAACASEFAVLTASSASRALELLREHDVAVVMADQRMPKTTGVELLEVVRRDYPDAVRILITAYTDLPAAIDAINRGHVRRYLRKPCELDELRAELRDALDLYDLRHRVRDMERRMIQTERVYALGLVAASLSHELRNPISYVRDGVNITREDLTKLGKVLEGSDVDLRSVRAKVKELDEVLGDAQLGVNRMIDIIEGVSLPTRGSEGEEVDVPDVLRMVLRIVRGELRRGVQVELDSQPVPPVRANAAKLGQVLLNLVVNAIQAVGNEPRGEPVVTIRFARVDDFVRVDVLDNGPGIADSDLPRIFEPFFTTKGPEGTGLGLAVSRAIIADFGGTLDAENREEGGAAFRVRLPVYV